MIVGLKILNKEVPGYIGQDRVKILDLEIFDEDDPGYKIRTGSRLWV